MGKLAIVFPGQGAQYVGMGKELCESYKSAGDIFDAASSALGLDIKEMIFNGTDEILKITENTQPTILTMSVACYEVLKEKGVKPEVVAGLSLGEYAAHVVSGSIAFKDAVALVKKRGKYMQEAVPIGVGTMAAVLGLENEEVVRCCKEASSLGVVEPANFNCPGQVVIAGEVKAVEKAVELAKEKGAKRSMILPVSAPFHCSMLKPAGEKLAKELEGVRMNGMSIPVVTNVTGDFVVDAAKIKELLVVLKLKKRYENNWFG